MIRPKKLLVEGVVDKRVIVNLLISQGVNWVTDGKPIVHVDDLGGLPEILEDGVIESELRAWGLESLGIVVGANGDAAQQWQRIRERCRREIPTIPKRIPSEGLILEHDYGVRFGVWIMPDNQLCGMLEDYLVSLVPDEQSHLLELARRSVLQAKAAGAPFREVHRTKAEIHTWLAWQDKPGPQLHVAVLQRLLVPDRPESRKFIAWLRSLFEIYPEFLGAP